jgi:hypothetical protein
MFGARKFEYCVRCENHQSTAQAQTSALLAFQCVVFNSIVSSCMWLRVSHVLSISSTIK